MTAGFQCFYDKRGDIHVSGGVVVQPKHGVRIEVGPDATVSFARPGRPGADFREAAAVWGTTFVGGSGRNVISSGVVAGISGGPVPVGFFRPGVPNVYQLGFYVLTVTGPSAATISDGTNVVAALTSGGTAPVGSYVSTTYGRTTYNGGTAFTLTVTAEGGSVGIPGAVAYLSAGSAQDGSFVAVDGANFESAIDADWTLVLDPSGSAEMRYLTDVIAIRTAGTGDDPSGTYEATALGMATYNLTTAEPVDGEPWRAMVQVGGKSPRVGVVYIKLTESSGVLTTVDGPFFAGSMPSNSGSIYYLQIAYSDGADFAQEIIGAVVWP